MYVQGLEKIKGECRVGHVTTAVQVLRMVFLKKRRGKSVVVYIKWVCHPYVGSATALPDILLPLFIFPSMLPLLEM